LIRRTVLVAFRILALCGMVAVLLPQDLYAQDDLIGKLKNRMTREEWVGQLFMVDFAGDDTSEESAIAQLIREYKVGSVLVSESRGNISNQGEEPTPMQVARLSNDLQDLAHSANSRVIDEQEVFVPLFIAVQQEGNGYPYSQLRSGFTPLLSNMSIGATWSEQHAEAAGVIVGQELSAVGINMLLGPVIDTLDMPRSGGRGDLGVRVFGGNPDWVARLGRAYIRGVHEGSGSRVATVAKHFPGYGRSGRDPQIEVATINKSLEEIRALELMPFVAVTRFSAGDPLGATDALMISHVRSAAFQEHVEFFSDPLTLDEEGLSVAMALPEFAAWQSSGLLVADFLGAEAIKEHLNARQTGFPHLRVAGEALMAGNDILPLVHFSLGEDWNADDLPNIIDAIEYFQRLYNENRAFRDRVDESVRKVLQAKIGLYDSLSLSEVLVDEDLATSAVGAGGSAVRQIAEDALTLLYPIHEEFRTRLPDSPGPDDDVLILECFGDCYATQVLPYGAVQDALLRLYGPEGTRQVNPEKVDTLSFAQVHDWIEGDLTDSDRALVEGLIGDAEWVILALSDYNPDDFPASRAVKEFLQDRDYFLTDKKVVAIAYDAPYHLDESEVSKLTAYFAVYGKTGLSLETSLRPLFELDFIPAGAAPVDVEGVAYDLATALEPDPSHVITLERLSPPEGEDLYVGGNPLVVRTSIVLDRNGHPVPDGTEVEFRGNYLEGEIYLEPQVVTDTIGGVAGASFWLTEPAPAGLIEVTAASGEASSRPLVVSLVVPVTPFPTFTPTATATPSPTPTATPVAATPITRPTPTTTPVPPPEPHVHTVGWLDFLLAGAGIVVGNLVGLRARRGRRKGWEREVQLILYGVALGLIAYILYGLGLLNPARILGWQGASVRVFLLFFCAVLAFLPGGADWPRRS